MPQLATPERIREVTGYKRRAEQLAWLRRHGIEPFIGRRGEISVYEEVLLEVQCRMSNLEAQKVLRKGPRPNLRAVT